MNHTNIEWVRNPDGSQGYTWSPVTGCLNSCSYCYARKLANTRLREVYLANDNVAPDTKDHEGYSVPYSLDYRLKDPFYPRFWPEKLKIPGLPKEDEWMFVKPENMAKHAGVFCCSMSDLFGIGVPEDWTQRVLDIIRQDWRDRFYLLTKQPQNLSKFSPFPDNAWVGVSATDTEMLMQACSSLEEIRAKVKYLSIEPLLDWSFNWNQSYLANAFKRGHIGLIIIGAQTKPTVMPRIEWVKEIVDAADKAGCKVFLKDSLKPLVSEEFHGQTVIESHQLWAFKYFKLRQEMSA